MWGGRPWIRASTRRRPDAGGRTGSCPVRCCPDGPTLGSWRAGRRVGGRAVTERDRPGRRRRARRGVRRRAAHHPRPPPAQGRARRGRRCAGSSGPSSPRRPTTRSGSSCSRAPATTSVRGPTGCPPTCRGRSPGPGACSGARLSRPTASSACCSRCNCRWSARSAGWAAGLGCQMALASDFTVATEDSRFWLPFVRRGFTPDSGATWLVPRLVGVARAKQLLLLGRPVSGAEAATWGMIHQAVAADELVPAVDALVDELSRTANRGCRPHEALRQRGTRRRRGRGDGAGVDGARVVVAHGRLPRGPRRVP